MFGDSFFGKRFYGNSFFGPAAAGAGGATGLVLAMTMGLSRGIFRRVTRY